MADYTLSHTGAEIDDAIGQVKQNAATWNEASSSASQANTKASQALSKALSVEAALADKADLTTLGGAKKLRHNQLPMLALQSVSQLADADGENNKMWWSSENGNLKYRSGGTVYDLGYPPQYNTLYFCGTKIYKWNGSGFTQMEGGGGSGSSASEEIESFGFSQATRKLSIKQAGHEAKEVTLPVATSTEAGLMSSSDKVKISTVDNKANIDPDTQRLDLDHVFRIGLASMGSVLDNIDGGIFAYNPIAGDLYFNQTTNKLVYQKTAGSSVEYDPPFNVIFCNLHTGRLYIYKATGWAEVGSQVVDNLTTESAVKPLSAKQGKWLYDNGVTDISSIRTADVVRINYTKGGETHQFSIPAATPRTAGVLSSDGATLLSTLSSLVGAFVFHDIDYQLPQSICSTWDNDYPKNVIGVDFTVFLWVDPNADDTWSVEIKEKINGGTRDLQFSQSYDNQSGKLSLFVQAPSFDSTDVIINVEE